MENRKRERIIEAGMALLLVITLLAAGQSGKIPVVKSQEIQVQADSGKENESKEKRKYGEYRFGDNGYREKFRGYREK